MIFDLLLDPLLQVVRLVLLPSIASADFEANCRTIDSPTVASETYRREEGKIDCDLP